MYRESFGAGMAAGGFMVLFIPLIIALVAWSVVWKGWALWKAAREGSKGWFVAFLLINTLGILEILYIYVFSKKKEQTPISPTSLPQ